MAATLTAEEAVGVGAEGQRGVEEEAGTGAVEAGTVVVVVGTEVVEEGVDTEAVEVGVGTEAVEVVTEVTAVVTAVGVATGVEGIKGMAAPEGGGGIQAEGVGVRGATGGRGAGARTLEARVEVAGDTVPEGGMGDTFRAGVGAVSELICFIGVSCVNFVNIDESRGVSAFPSFEDI